MKAEEASELYDKGVRSLRSGASTANVYMILRNSQKALRKTCPWAPETGDVKVHLILNGKEMLVLKVQNGTQAASGR